MTNQFQSLFNVPREHFWSDATKSYDWRIDQLNRMERLIADNKDALCGARCEDFGKPPFDQLFEITVPTRVIHYYCENRKALMATRASPILCHATSSSRSSGLRILPKHISQIGFRIDPVGGIFGVPIYEARLSTPHRFSV